MTFFAALRRRAANRRVVRELHHFHTVRAALGAGTVRNSTRWSNR